MRFDGDVWGREISQGSVGVKYFNFMVVRDFLLWCNVSVMEKSIDLGLKVVIKLYQHLSNVIYKFSWYYIYEEKKEAFMWFRFISYYVIRLRCMENYGN